MSDKSITEGHEPRPANHLREFHDHWMREAEEAYALWLKMVRDDAEKEFQMGNVEDQQLRDFLEKVK